MDKQRRDAIAATERTIEASKALRANLRTGEMIGEKMIRELKGSRPIYETVTATGSDPADLRQDTNDLLDNFEVEKAAQQIHPTVALPDALP